jgi:hypothetical protein
MALNIGSTTVVNNTPNASWTFITSRPTNLVTTVNITGTGTTTLYCNTSSSGTINFVRV